MDNITTGNNTYIINPDPDSIETLSHASAKGLDILWLRASILGAVWASAEIVLGSFLHNLKLPFAGTILSAIAVFLLASFDSRWKDSRVIWRAGVIAAIMKSVSPSSVIFGPMIGIYMESVIFYYSIRILGRNIAGYAIAGAISVSWSFFQKAISLIISYGTDFIQLLNSLYKYTARILLIENLHPLLLIFFVLLIYFLMGAIAALAGFTAGRKTSDSYFTLNSTSSDNSLLNNTGTLSAEGNPIFWIASVIMIMTASLIAITFLPLSIAAVCTIAVLSFLYFRNKRLIKRVLKIRFWLEMSVIAILAGMFLGRSENNSGIVSIEGFYSGIRMIMRALTVTCCFGVLGYELTNQRVRKILFRKRFRTLALALETAFSTLPSLITIMSENRKKFRNPSLLVTEYIASADRWIDIILNNNQTGRYRENDTGKQLIESDPDYRQ